jgi:uncharacterized protein YigE (DUF2233 family)
MKLFKIMVRFFNQVYVLFFVVVITCTACHTSAQEKANYTIEQPDNLLVHVVDLNKTDLSFFYKNESGENFNNHGNLKKAVLAKNKKLLFAVNGGMYNQDHTPQGLYIEKGNQIAPIDTQTTGYGNFYLQPNGIFFLTKDKTGNVVETEKFVLTSDIKHATQSGPMLLIDGEIHPKFREGSSNLHIRNGVGILPDGRILFVMSKEKINFFDLATYFKSQGCQNALYLDGFVSRTYLPAQNWEQTEGSFGVIIGELDY